MSKTSLNCRRHKDESVRKVYSSEDGASIRLLCVDCLFEDPDFVKANTARIATIEDYLDSLSARIEDSKRDREVLRTGLSEELSEFIQKKEEIDTSFEGLLTSEYGKVKDLFIAQLEKIREQFETVLASYKKAFDLALSTFQRNSGFVKDEIYNKFFLIDEVDKLDKSKLLEALEEAADPEQFLKLTEMKTQKKRLDLGNTQAYCALLVNKLTESLENPPTFLENSLLEKRLNNLSIGVTQCLKDICSFIDDNCVKNLEVNPIDSDLNFDRYSRRVSRDGFSALVQYDPNKQVSFRLANKILCSSGSVLSCIAAIEDRYLAAGSKDGKIAVYRLEDGEFLGLLEGHPSAVTTMVGFVDPGQNPLICSAANEADGSILLSNAKSLKTVKELRGGHTGGVCSLSTTADGRTVISGGQDGVLCIWDLASASDCLAVRQVAHRIGITCVRLDESADRLVSGSRDGYIADWRIEWTRDGRGKTIKGLQLQNKIERTYSIANIILRQALRGSQLVAVSQGGTLESPRSPAGDHRPPQDARRRQTRVQQSDRRLRHRRAADERWQERLCHPQHQHAR